MGRFGVAVWNFEGESLISKLNTFADMGFDAASVQGDFLGSLSGSEADMLSSTLAARDMLLTVHTGFAGPDGINEERTLRQAERILEWHGRTGQIACLTYDVPWIELSPGIYRTDPEQIARIFHKILYMSLSMEVRVALEDCPLNMSHIPELESWAAAYPHWGILIDLGHMNMRLQEPKHDPRPISPAAVEKAIRGLPLEVVELHVHSNNGTADQHAPPYDGNADMKTAGGTLREIGFDGISTVELVPAWCGLSPDEGLAAARKSLEFWKSCLQTDQ